MELAAAVAQLAKVIRETKGETAAAAPVSARTSPASPPSDRVQRCQRWLEKAPDAISGQGGHNTTFAAACTCFRFGLSEGEAWALLSGWYNPMKCKPAWGESDLRHKITDARDTVAKAGETGKFEQAGPALIRQPPPTPGKVNQQSTTPCQRGFGISRNPSSGHSSGCCCKRSPICAAHCPSTSLDHWESLAWAMRRWQKLQV